MNKSYDITGSGNITIEPYPHTCYPVVEVRDNIAVTYCPICGKILDTQKVYLGIKVVECSET